MRVEFINKDYIKEEFFKMWGTAACTCYNTPVKYAERVGKSCLDTGHFSGSRGMFFTFKISDVPRSLVDQLVRHEIGVFKNVQSFRYVNKDMFAYYIPPIIENCPAAAKLYHSHMAETARVYCLLQDTLKENYPNMENEKINQSARGILPMNTNTELVIGFTIEGLIHLCHERLCVCAEEHIRKLVGIIRKEVVSEMPILEEYLVAKCDAMLYCPESAKRTCGKYPQKDELKSLLTLSKK